MTRHVWSDGGIRAVPELRNFLRGPRCLSPAGSWLVVPPSCLTILITDAHSIVSRLLTQASPSFGMTNPSFNEFGVRVIHYGSLNCREIVVHETVIWRSLQMDHRDDSLVSRNCFTPGSLVVSRNCFTTNMYIGGVSQTTSWLVKILIVIISTDGDWPE